MIILIIVLLLAPQAQMKFAFSSSILKFVYTHVPCQYIVGSHAMIT